MVKFICMYVNRVMMANEVNTQNNGFPMLAKTYSKHVRRIYVHTYSSILFHI